jgi:hypothetical protein
MQVSAFIESCTYRKAVAYVKVSDLLKRYREQHPGYRRSCFLAELSSLRLQLGVQSDGQLVVVGRSWEPPKALKVKSGKLACA